MADERVAVVDVRDAPVQRLVGDQAAGGPTSGSSGILSFLQVPVIAVVKIRHFVACDRHARSDPAGGSHLLFADAHGRRAEPKPSGLGRGGQPPAGRIAAKRSAAWPSWVKMRCRAGRRAGCRGARSAPAAPGPAART